MVHAGEVLLALHGPQPADNPEHKETPTALGQAITEGPVKNLIASTRALTAGTATQSAGTKRWVIFENNVDRMQYGTFRAKRILHRFGSRGGGLQISHWRALQTIGHALVGTGAETSWPFVVFRAVAD